MSFPQTRLRRLRGSEGLRNMLRAELGKWFRTNMWWVQALIWIGVIDGILAVVKKSESLGFARYMFSSENEWSRARDLIKSRYPQR